MKKTTLYVMIAVIAVLLGAAIWLLVDNRQTKEEMQEMVEQMTFEKEQLADEYEDLALQFDGYGRNLNNDSLADKLAQEQQRVQDLLEELRITKATNARRIAELKKELATVRAVMVEYVHQIDSLNASNQRLTEENIVVKKQYAEASQRASALEEEKVKLTAVVNRAQMLEVSDFAFTTLNNRDKKTTRQSKIQKLQFEYAIMKNVAANTGVKRIYLRIVRPDGEVLTKNPANTFTYENKDIEYSLSKEFEYGGDMMHDVLYWNVEEMLPTGVYNADFFCEGNLIGSFPFAIGKSR